MAKTLSHASLPCQEDSKVQQDVLTISESRFPTEKEAEEKNMIHYLQGRDDTQCRIHDYNCKDALRPYQMWPNKVGQKANPICNQKSKFAFH